MLTMRKLSETEKRKATTKASSMKVFAFETVDKSNQCTIVMTLEVDVVLLSRVS